MKQDPPKKSIFDHPAVSAGQGFSEAVFGCVEYAVAKGHGPSGLAFGLGSIPTVTFGVARNLAQDNSFADTAIDVGVDVLAGRIVPGPLQYGIKFSEWADAESKKTPEYLAGFPLDSEHSLDRLHERGMIFACSLPYKLYKYTADKVKQTLHDIKDGKTKFPPLLATPLAAAESQIPDVNTPALFQPPIQVSPVITDTMGASSLPLGYNPYEQSFTQSVEPIGGASTNPLQEQYESSPITIASKSVFSNKDCKFDKSPLSQTEALLTKQAHFPISRQPVGRYFEPNPLYAHLNDHVGIKLSGGSSGFSAAIEYTLPLTSYAGWIVTLPQKLDHSF